MKNQIRKLTVKKTNWLWAAMMAITVTASFGMAGADTPESPDAQTPTVCPVHEENLQRDSVEIRYGLIRLDEDYIEARQKLFPFSNLTVGGGCVISDDSPRTQEVDFCEQCRSAERAWKEENTKSKK